MTWKSRKAPQWLPILAGLGLVLTGCATADVNPPQARAQTGYVDLHADTPGQFSWQVSRFDPRTRQFQRFFSDFNPPPQGIVRLPFAPGQYRLRVEIINLLTTGPVDFKVRVEDGKITPVRFTFTRAGTGEVESIETSVGGTLYGTYGRNTHISDDPEAEYRVSDTVEQPLVYRPKEEMPYARTNQ